MRGEGKRQSGSAEEIREEREKAANAPAREDAEPHRRETHDARVAVEGEVVRQVVLGQAAAEADEVGGVTADDAQTARRWFRVARLAPPAIRHGKERQRGTYRDR